MPSRLREPFGKAGLIVAIVALVASLAGGAIAANQATDSGKRHSKRAKKKKKKQKGVTVSQVRKIAKQEARKFANSNPGPAGPQGPAGAAGPAGAKGDKGDNGSNGTNGSNGQSVKSESEPPGPNCEAGGSKLTSASATDYVCNGLEGSQGDKGSPWVVGQAPAGALLRGTFSIAGTAAAAGERVSIPVSTSVPVSSTSALIFADVVQPGGPDQWKEFLENELGVTGCEGNPADPTPAGQDGIICIYVSSWTGLEFDFNSGTLFQSGGGAFGNVKTSAAGPYSAQGVWVVRTLE